MGNDVKNVDSCFEFRASPQPCKGFDNSVALCCFENSLLACFGLPPFQTPVLGKECVMCWRTNRNTKSLPPHILS